MRRFSGITNINSPKAISREKTQQVQRDIMVLHEKEKCNTGRTGMSIQPYRTEFRNIFK